MNIELEGIRNARDFSEYGYPKAIRSAHLHDMSDKDWDLLKKQYDLKTVIDLRTSQEATEQPDRIPQGLNYLHIPVFDVARPGVSHEEESDKVLENQDQDSDQSPKAPDLKELYVMMTTDPGCKAQLSKALEVINDPNRQGSILWHCTEGKDRCGLVSALYLLEHGFDDETVMKDYLKTNEGAVPRAEKFYQQVLESTRDSQAAESVKNAFLAKEEYLRPVLGNLKEIVSRYID